MDVKRTRPVIPLVMIKHAFLLSHYIPFPAHSPRNMDSDLNCGSGGGSQTKTSLRILSIFIILIGSLSGALFPVFARRSSWLHVPKGVFESVNLIYILSRL